MFELHHRRDLNLYRPSCRFANDGQFSKAHASMFHEDFNPHVSFKNPCKLRTEREGVSISLAHVGHNSNRALDPIEEIAYRLSGGAADIACGLNPAQVQLSYGRFTMSRYGH